MKRFLLLFLCIAFHADSLVRAESSTWDLDLSSLEQIATQEEMNEAISELVAAEWSETELDPVLLHASTNPELADYQTFSSTGDSENGQGICENQLARPSSQQYFTVAATVRARLPEQDLIPQSRPVVLNSTSGLPRGVEDSVWMAAGENTRIRYNLFAGSDSSLYKIQVETTTPCGWTYFTAYFLDYGSVETGMGRIVVLPDGRQALIRKEIAFHARNGLSMALEYFNYYEFALGESSVTSYRRIRVERDRATNAITKVIVVDRLWSGNGTTVEEFLPGSSGWDENIRQLDGFAEDIRL